MYLYMLLISETLWLTKQCQAQQYLLFFWFGELLVLVMQDGFTGE